MKKKILYALLVIAVPFSSCRKDFLDRKPLDELVDDTFFQNEEQLQLAVNACYAYIKGKNTLDMENIGDNTLNSSSNDYLRISTGNFNNDVTGINSDWTTAYDGIRRCNAFLENYQKAQGREAIKDGLAAEVRFIRAYLYSYLTLFFGDVQLIKKPCLFLIRKFTEHVTRKPKLLILCLPNYRMHLPNYR